MTRTTAEGWDASRPTTRRRPRRVGRRGAGPERVHAEVRRSGCEVRRERGDVAQDAERDARTPSRTQGSADGQASQSADGGVRATSHRPHASDQAAGRRRPTEGSCPTRRRRRRGPGRASRAGLRTGGTRSPVSAYERADAVAARTRAGRGSATTEHPGQRRWRRGSAARGARPHAPPRSASVLVGCCTRQNPLKLARPRSTIHTIDAEHDADDAEDQCRRRHPAVGRLAACDRLAAERHRARSRAIDDDEDAAARDDAEDARHQPPDAERVLVRDGVAGLAVAPGSPALRTAGPGRTAGRPPYGCGGWPYCGCWPYGGCRAAAGRTGGWPYCGWPYCGEPYGAGAAGGTGVRRSAGGVP